MAIDNCQYSFQELATDVLPGYMQQMRWAIAEPYPMAEFGRKGIGPKTMLRRLGHSEDFAGCYVLLDQDKAVYVGISRTVVQRLLQHVKGKTHNNASLAYRIASKKYPLDLNRNEAMKVPAFRAEFDKAKDHLKSLQVAFVPIDNAVELHLFEVYCAMELDAELNTFRTH